MARRSNVEKIIKGLRQAEVLQGQGKTVAQSCKAIGIDLPNLLPMAKGIQSVES